MLTAKGSLIKLNMIGTDLSVNQISQSIVIDQAFGSCYQIQWSGNFTGTFGYFASLEGITAINPLFDYITGSVIQITGGLTASGDTSFLWKYDGSLFEMMQLRYAHTSGTGTLLKALWLYKGY